MEIKVKIGILTFHHVDNYGATLQAYALQKFLRSQGHDVETIDYRPLNAVKYYTKGLSPISKGLKLNSFAARKIFKAWRMRQFLLKHLKLSSSKIYNNAKLRKLESSYDVVIVGSDQVWCLEPFRGFDPAFFLDFVADEVAKISYASSFGSTTHLDIYKEQIYKLVNRFNTILVRDQNSKEIIEGECQKSAEVVLDPTFLVKYDDLLKSVKYKENYILLYNQSDLNESEEEFVSVVSKKKNLKIVSVGKYNRIADENFITADPSDWLSLFKAATYVVTNTYHGTIFSLIFQKSFTVLFSSKKTNKTSNLLGQIGLEGRILLNSNDQNMFLAQLEEVKYEDFQETLDQRIIESKNALISALKKLPNTAH
ncbi:polysaccharide pyruvyl transferase family protein [Nodosilinea sp. LEGE 07298]|uniref:polysaccharide pyruvyl transferase family protein n=1 Tax=Nodosilinea sp. LEGE 07298 TaxID=2777970 RepID=UPI0018830B6C|nr:polysaccharide pyruvyl transferase family protein [Nodosilinea sp. LEGE 07298]MBE9109959.1 polysaccharide pyruvyl transferase family protein [Nodosilinea sp. LEGE 07298]